MISVMGKSEGPGEMWHGHVTALTVAPEYRRLGLAAALMNNLETISEQWVPLFAPEVIKLFPSSAQLSMKFQLLINVEIVEVSGNFRFKTQKLVIYPAHKC